MTVTIATVWERIQRQAGTEFRTVTGLLHLRVIREGEEINRSLSRTNFERALAFMPAAGPGALKDRQGASYTWAILMDPRIRRSDW